MQVNNIAKETYQLSVNVENILFEGLWEMPNGVSLNSYIIKGEKTAIVDGVCGWDGVPESLFALLDKLNINPKDIEYLIVNHVEPDHSGWIEAFKKINKNFQVVCSKKGKELLSAFYGQTENITVVGEKDTLDLGNGHVITFTEIPNVHWPDTIAAFDTLTGTLFSCDAFGSFGKLEDKIYADQFSEEELKEYEKDTVRYYSNIVAHFSPQVKKAVAKCRELPVKQIAPGHGLIWREPAKIMDAYSDYADYQKGPARKEITFIWGSMYGMTETAVKHAIKMLEKKDITLHVHQVPKDSWGTVLTSAWTSTGIIVAMPTYEFKMFPPMGAVLEELGKKKVFNRKAFRFGSYGWSGGAQRELDEITTRLGMNWEFVEPVEFLGKSDEEVLSKISEQIDKLVSLVEEAVK
ncbi:MBL fold hydrolase [Anaerocolumna cellulosilytica]|uniref:MBL fold hydrolase n=1 Tax=Anaerocolumna cellulosilytica TaxID=433286 RepID=A0A6S6RAX4_9FIRM|nr:FprA family A-type flavoprotein [Anaerocolumna cellulosilytica]MBB5195074.1 flavorubredoxin [Anaerocolumna cellulosilytica]BCJ96088.1 MBL fold hydrolase [Anaerocolumna cellulosilytica]